MSEFSTGETVRIDIPDETDPDHDAYHGEHGHVIDIVEGEMTTITGEQVEEIRYRIRLPDGEELELPSHAIRPSIQ